MMQSGHWLKQKVTYTQNFRCRDAVGGELWFVDHKYVYTILIYYTYTYVRIFLLIPTYM